MTPAPESRSLTRPIELGVVIPTFNERENISPLLAALEEVLAGTEWEVIFVDDNSSDGTAEYIRGVAALDQEIRVLERTGPAVFLRPALRGCCRLQGDTSR